MRTTALIFLAISVYAVLVMLQREAASEAVAENLGNDSYPVNGSNTESDIALCDVIQKPRAGKGKCPDFCNNLHIAFKIQGSHMSRCLSKCKQLYGI